MTDTLSVDRHFKLIADQQVSVGILNDCKCFHLTILYNFVLYSCTCLYYSIYYYLSQICIYVNLYYSNELH